MRAYITPNQCQPVAVVSNTGQYRYDCLDVTGNQVCFEGVIYSNPLRIESWSNSNYDCPLGRNISKYIPLCLFHGKREGDTIDLKFFNKKYEAVTVTVQLCSGIQSGNFQDILYDRTHGFAGVYVFSDDPNAPTRATQYYSIILAHELYAKSIGKPIIHPNNFRCSSSWILCMKEEIKEAPILNKIPAHGEFHFSHY